MSKAASSVDDDKSSGFDLNDLSALGFTKVAYAVDETLELLSIGRTALYAAVKRGDLKRVKFGKKTLFYAADLAAFLARLRLLSRTLTSPSNEHARAFVKYRRCAMVRTILSGRVRSGGRFGRAARVTYMRKPEQRA